MVNDNSISQNAKITTLQSIQSAIVSDIDSVNSGSQGQIQPTLPPTSTSTPSVTPPQDPSPIVGGVEVSQACKQAKDDLQVAIVGVKNEQDSLNDDLSEIYKQGWSDVQISAQKAQIEAIHAPGVANKQNMVNIRQTQVDANCQ